MKITVYSRGTAHISADSEHQEPAVRSALAAFRAGEVPAGHVAGEITDFTDWERSDVSHDEYAVVSEDDGTELWRGWLSEDPDAPPPAESTRAGSAGPAEPSEAAPVYRKVNGGGGLRMIECNEGWRSTVLCSDMYESDADFLLSLLGRTPRSTLPAPAPAGYQGPAQHTYTAGCDGFHEPGQCARAGQ